MELAAITQRIIYDNKDYDGGQTTSSQFFSSESSNQSSKKIIHFEAN
jgi:hypothetical protein